MWKATGTIIAVDHHPGPPQAGWNAYQFHVLVELIDGRKVRLRGPSHWSKPLVLYQFGEGATVLEVQNRLALGAVIEFWFLNVPETHKGDQDYHPWDVFVLRPDLITRDYSARRSGQVIDFAQKRALRVQRS